MLKIKFKKTKKSLKNLPRTLAEKNFLTFLGLLLVVLFLGLIILYYYVFLIEMIDEIIEKEELLKLDTETQRRVLEEWQKRNEKFLEADIKEYPDPFRVD